MALVLAQTAFLFTHSALEMGTLHLLRIDWHMGGCFFAFYNQLCKYLMLTQIFNPKNTQEATDSLPVINQSKTKPHTYRPFCYSSL